MENDTHIHNEKCDLYGTCSKLAVLTPEQVRDALVKCFSEAHSDILKNFKGDGD